MAEVERFTEVRVTFVYGVNTTTREGRVYHDVRTTVADLQERFEVESMGRMSVSKVETRTVTRAPWVEVIG